MTQKRRTTQAATKGRKDHLEVRLQAIEADVKLIKAALFAPRPKGAKKGAKRKKAGAVAFRSFGDAPGTLDLSPLMPEKPTHPDREVGDFMPKPPVFPSAYDADNARKR